MGRKHGKKWKGGTTKWPVERPRVEYGGTADKFTSLRELGNLGNRGDAFVGTDLRLYRTTQGAMSVITAVAPKEDTPPKWWLKGVDWADFPPMEELNYLRKTFLAKYPKEVAFIMGRRFEDGQFIYLVPEQEGSTGHVDTEGKQKGKWRSQQAIEKFLDEAQFIGTVHTHPGEGAYPSSTDEAWWTNPSMSGLHVIFGRTGKFSITGSAAGHMLVLEQGTLDGVGETPVELRFADGKPVEELLLDPPPPPPLPVLRGTGSLYVPGSEGSLVGLFDPAEWGLDDGNGTTRKLVERIGRKCGVEFRVEKVAQFVVRIEGMVTFATANQVLALKKRVEGTDLQMEVLGWRIKA